MHELQRHGDVLRIRFWSRLGAAAGYDASIYVDRGMMVDTAFPHVSKDVARLVKELGPRAAYVTHWHEDHAGNVPLLATLGVPMVISDATASKLRERPRIRLYRKLVWGQTPRLETPAREAEVAEAADGQASRALEFIHTPGHSPDHHVVWDAERRTLFSGDLFLGVKVRVAHPAERPRELLHSLRRMAALEPERMFDTHRGLVPDAAAALRAKAAWMEDTIGEIEERIARGLSDGAIRHELFGGESLDGYFSRMEYARINFIRAVRETMADR